MTKLFFTFILLFSSSLIAADRPNIIIILVDDMGYSDIGCYGGEIDTPNIDALAKNGLRFKQFYNSGRCCPTRASLMTGLHPHQVGIGHMTLSPSQKIKLKNHPYQGYLNKKCVTIAEVLKEANYHTLMTGKWHLGLEKDCWPTQRGFEKFYGIHPGAAHYFKPEAPRGLTLGEKAVKATSTREGEGYYMTDAFTDYACQFIKEANTQDSSKPFFLYLAYNAPHWPLHAKEKDIKKYLGKYKKGWKVLKEERFAKMKEMGIISKDAKLAPMEGGNWDSLSAEEKKLQDLHMAAYAACIDSIDQNLGKLFNTLQDLKKFDDTIMGQN